jgi:Protein of unknown function (DUF3105)
VADKPRVKAPKQRTAPSRADVGRRKLLFGVGGALGVAVLVAVGVFVLLGSSGGGDLRSQLEAAGCTLKDYPGVSRRHITNPNARPKEWNSFPPTSGPHYFTPAVYGIYTEPLQLARVLHNLEHGGVYMLYGSKTPADTASKLGEVYDKDPRGLVVAPLPELGKTIALGAWTSEHPGSGEVGTGHLAKCTKVDTGAAEAFIKEYRGRGPEGEQLDQLQPGGT